jgi:hypothetical protein
MQALRSHGRDGCVGPSGFELPDQHGEVALLRREWGESQAMSEMLVCVYV